MEKEKDKTIRHQENAVSINEAKSEEIQLEHVPESTGSPLKALCMLLKAFVGTGVVFLPGSFASGGLVFSICLLIFIAVVCLLSFHLLVIVQRQVGGSYEDVGNALYGRWLRYIILFFVCISQMGFVSSYMIFISENVGIVIDTLTSCHAPFQSHYLIWIFLLVIIPLTWLRKLARFSWLAVLADLFILFGILCILYMCSDQIARHGPGPNIILLNTNDFALMIGTAVFSYEGIGMVVPIVEGMKEPKKFPIVLNVGILIATVIFVTIGTIGYIAFGEGTKASVVANLPQTPLSIAVQLVYACAMILTCPFMLYPAIRIVEQGIFGTRSGREHTKWKWLKSMSRSGVALICGVISFAVGSDGLSKFVALVGSVACMPLCFIFPAMFHYKMTTGVLRKSGDVVLGLFGIGIMIYTMYININSWVHPVFSALPASVCGVRESL
ncbi:transmembrane amino acid transporter protein-domain-containing protein [Spinellus fusiger]|nr:transmembrane amino acid transporter protein-domain-containing protein [Spinellus fusiger]